MALWLSNPLLVFFKDYWRASAPEIWQLMKLLDSSLFTRLSVAAVCLLVGTAWAQQRGDENVVTANDSDGDRIVDTIDVDDDNDGIPDVLEIAGNGLDVDSDNDGMPDRLDLDSDNDGILDWQESGVVISVDFSEMRVLSGRILGPVGANGYIDALETAVDNGVLRYTLVNTDAPADDLPDVIDLDSDNDGLPDMLEAGVNPDFDSDNDARIDSNSATASVGNDGIPDRLQSTNDKTCCDVTGDGVEDIVPRNTDGGDFPDYQDSDSDNDGVSDLVEAGGSDFDRDGRVDNFFDSPVLDGMDDAILSVPFSQPDVNGNAVADFIDAFAQTGTPGPAEQPTNVPVTSTLTPESVERDPVPRPGENILPSGNEGQVIDGPVNDDPLTGNIKTGLNAAGCSVQSSGMDLILLLLSVLSITVMGWRNSVKRLSKKRVGE